jgi:DNA modification methylase
MAGRILIGDALEHLRTLPDGIARTCVTSPPYFGLRDYGTGDAQIGLEQTPADYIERLVDVFREVRRVLADDGTLWLNLGDSYASHKGASQGVDPKSGARRFGVRPNDKPMGDGTKHKDLLGIPWRVALALQSDGWYLRSDIIWHKPNPMPESVKDRPTKSHEYLFLLAKQQRYYYDSDAVREPAKDCSKGGPGTGIKETQHYGAGNGGNSGLASLAAKYKDGDSSPTRNRRSVWTVATRPFKGAHFATFPPALIEPCILAGSAVGDTVIDPFFGAGTTALVAEQHGRRCIGIELNPEYAKMAAERIVAARPKEVTA